MKKTMKKVHNDNHVVWVLTLKTSRYLHITKLLAKKEQHVMKMKSELYKDSVDYNM